MRLVITIDLDNDQFNDIGNPEINAEVEVAQVLRQVAHEFAHDERYIGVDKKITDINGNTIGLHSFQAR